MPDIKDINQTDRIFVLLSGGLDSSTALAYARNYNPHVDIECVTIDYGQRHKREIEAAKALADHYHATHTVIDAKGFMTGMLVDKGEKNEEVPNASYDDLPEGISPTYVSFRNGLMLSILAARAQSWIMERQKADREYEEGVGGRWPETVGDGPNGERQFNVQIWCGVHADDGARDAYPDCQAEFIGPMAAAIARGTYNRVRLKAPFLEMAKSMIVVMGSQFQRSVPFAKTWSCYEGGEKHCGVCPTCRARKDAFAVASQVIPSIKDPTLYAQ